MIPMIANRLKVDWKLSTRKAAGCVWFDQLPLTPSVAGRIISYPLGVSVTLKTRSVSLFFSVIAWV